MNNKFHLPDELNMAENSMEKKQEAPCTVIDPSDEDQKAPDEKAERTEDSNAKENAHTEESQDQETDPLAEDDDLDVIDCYTDDFDSDMENDYCKKEAKKDKDRKSRKKEQFNTTDTVDPTSTVETAHPISTLKTAIQTMKQNNGNEERDPLDVSQEKDLDDEVDEDVIQLCDDISDTFLDETSSTSVAIPAKPEVPPTIQNKSEKDRILSEPLVKQMIVPEICVSDEEDEKISVGSQESLSLQIVHCLEKAGKVVDEVRRKSHDNTADGTVKKALNSSNCSDSGLHGCHEDPDVLKLKLDLYQDMGGMDYETDDKTDDCEKLPSARIKQEPCPQPNSPEEIPTIELSSTEDEPEPISYKQMAKSPPVEKRKKRKSKKKASKECSEIRMVSSEDSFPIVVDSTVSIDSRRTRNDSEGSLDDSMIYSDGRMKALRNRTVAIFPEFPCGKKTKYHRRSTDTDPLEAPVKKKKKIDPSMMGYHKRRKTTPYRSGSKCSIISASTTTSSIPDEDMIVLSANDVLLADPIQAGLTKDIENNKLQQEETNDTADIMKDKSVNDSKEELMHSLDLKETISKEFEQDAPSNSEKNESNENDFPIPTTDIALEDMLDSFIDKEQNDCDAAVVFHSISPEEKFLMDSLFADCEKQTQQAPSHEHLESLNTIMDDGKPLVEPSSVEQFAISYTICDGSVQPATVLMPLDNVAPVAGNAPNTIKVPKAPNIKIIQNYQKYPFQAKPPKKQQSKATNANGQPRRGRGRKKREAKDGTDEEYIPSSSRTGKRNSKAQKSRKNNPTATKHPVAANSNHEEEPNADYQRYRQENFHQPQSGNHHDLKFDNGEDDDDGTGTTSTACRNMPTLEMDLALTSSDESFGTISKELIATSTSKISSSSHEDGTNIGKLQQVQPTSQCVEKGVLGSRAFTREKPLGVLPKRGRPKTSKNQKISDFYDPVGNRKYTKAQDVSKESPTKQLLDKGINVSKKTALKRKLRRLFSSSEDEAGPLSHYSATEMYPDLQPSASSFGSVIEPTYEDNQLDKTQAAADKMDSLQVVISPLTEDKIRKINTPQKKPKALAKASQTEISGLTWSVDLAQIDFQSEYFEKLRILLNNGAVRNVMRGTKTERHKKSGLREIESSTSVRSFNGVDMPCRSILQGCLDSTSPAQPPSIPDGYNRSSTEDLLFQRALDEVDTGTSHTEDRSAVKRLERVVNTVRTSFRIPKLNKQASTSPQVVTSSTSHVAERATDDMVVEELPSTSRSADQLQQNNRPFGSLRLPCGAGVVQRTISNEYVNDQSGYQENSDTISRQDHQEMRQSIMMQERFEAPSIRSGNSGRNSPQIFENSLSSGYVPPSNAVNGPQANGHPSSNQEARSVSVPSSLENRSGLPSQAELMNVRRTIRNDMSQPQQLAMPGLPQPFAQSCFVPDVKYNASQQQNLGSMFGNFQQAPFAASSNMFNRGSLFGYPGMDMMSMNGYNVGMQQPQNRGNASNNFTDFLSMILEQLKQQQQIPMQPPYVQPPINPPAVPIQNIQNMLVQSGSNPMSGFNQLYPQVSQNPMQSSAPPAEPQRANDQVEMICSIFGCIDFLTDKCIKTHCRYSHSLPREEDLFQKLSVQSRDAIMAAYRFVAGRDDIFVKYFPVFATVMGRNNMRHQLVNTIGDCEQSKRPIQYYRYIVEGLKISGTSPVQAVQIILEKHTKKSFHQINVLIELIIDTAEGIITFLRTLEEFSHVKDYHYEIVSINRLLEFCVISMSPVNELAAFVCKLMLRVSVGEEHLVNTRVLLEFIQKVRLDPSLALDIEDIVKKYGSVVMRP
ncbi:uncharacterized protein LOC134225129 isoform X2 [Armigeres subalbatus]|uniref:uncharacterized protein LOC134225129 isoform X2 n=1 Tax=Armigeres subalbatus TaxID=124917 RepID=UPI002ED01F09